MKKQILFLLVVLSLIAIPLWAASHFGGMEQAAHLFPASKTIKMRISGSAIPLADPLAEPFPVLASGEGSGTIGPISGQGMYLYDRLIIGSDGRIVLRLLEGQMSIHLKAYGEMLLAVLDPGETGWMQINPDTGEAVWEQIWTGRIVGGTGRFAGIEGSFSKHAKGLAILSAPGQPSSAVVMPWTETLEIQLEE
ncbi:MAG: hypothetical protein P8Z37_12700 [Acidobacteriota bacterium]|jgi:hypothetical protein